MRQFKCIQVLVVLLFLSVMSLSAQEVISGGYKELIIEEGRYEINKNVVVSESLIINPGAIITLVDGASIISLGSIIMDGKDKGIEISSAKNSSGGGLIIKGNSQSKIDIQNTTFKNLILPLFFDVNWSRESVIIKGNSFLDNIGKKATIQILNPPYNYFELTEIIIFSFEGNLFSGNKSPIYIEDIINEKIQFKISNNAFVSNTLYGFGNYSIANNIIHGRADFKDTYFSNVIENNSFYQNYLINTFSDTIVRQANVGVFGTLKAFNLKNNFLGNASLKTIKETFYDQSVDADAPNILVDEFSKKPSNSAYPHVYEVVDSRDNVVLDSFKLKETPFNFILKSNQSLNFSNAKVKYVFFESESSAKKIDTLAVSSFKLENNNSIRMNVLNEINKNNTLGYFKITNLSDQSNKPVGDVYLGYGSFLKEKYIREELKRQEEKDEEIEKEVEEIEEKLKSSVTENIFEKINDSFKNKLEASVSFGSVIYTGSISNDNIFKNDINSSIGVSFTYYMYSKLSFSMAISSFKMSNSDLNSDNSDKIQRGMSFISNGFSVSPGISYDFVHFNLFSRNKLRPSVGIGLNLLNYKPTGVYKGKTYDLNPLGTGGQLIDPEKTPYSLMTVGYFFNFKLKYRWSERNSVGISFSLHKYLSDYLDDVGSDTFPNASELLNNSGAEAAYFSNPTGFDYAPGTFRNGASNGGDGYIEFGIFYSRKLFK
jgi:hypothetical protein